MRKKEGLGTMWIGNTYGSGLNYNSAFYKKMAENRKNSMISKKQDRSVKIKKNISLSKYMVRVAEAKTPSQVSAIIRVARADIQFARSCNSDKGDVEKAIRILKQVIAKSQTKIKRLRTEEDMERQEQLARSAKKRKLEADIREKKIRRKNSRRRQEAEDTTVNEEVALERIITAETTGFGSASVKGAADGAATADIPAGGDCGSSIEVAL